jgi:hypothetical protein
LIGSLTTVGAKPIMLTTLMLSAVIIIVTMMVMVTAQGVPNITSITGGLHTDGSANILTGDGYLTIQGINFNPMDEENTSGYINNFGATLAYLQAYPLTGQSNTTVFATGFSATPFFELPDPTPQCVTWSTVGGTSACYNYTVYHTPTVTNVTSSSCTTSDINVIDCPANSVFTLTINGTFIESYIYACRKRIYARCAK